MPVDPALERDLDVLARLVSFDTTSHRTNRPLTDDVRASVATYDVRVLTDEDHGKVNLLLLTGPDRDDDAGLLLSGHTDVVPATEPTWEGDPFELRRAGDRVTGRGACDMKGAVALFLNLLIEASERTLLAPLGLLLTADEEVGSLGARRAAERWADVPMPRPTIIGEPTDLRVISAHKGHTKLRVRLHGRPAHSGSPHLGRNAIAGLGAVLDGLAEAEAELASATGPEAALFEACVPRPLLVPVMVRGGSAMNVVPERCELDVSVRTLPGTGTDELVAIIRATLERRVADIDGGPTGIELELLGENPPFAAEDGAPLDRALRAAVGQDRRIGVSYASDAGFLARDLGRSCVLFGPGSIEVAHQAEEWLPIDEFARARAILEPIVRRCCDDGEPIEAGPGLGREGAR